MIKSSKRTRQRRRKVTELDAEVRAVVFERDNYTCVKCGGKKALTPSHVLPKGKYALLRHDPMNLKTLCVACHLYWWHLSPIDAMQWFQEKYPDRYEYLMAKRRERHAQRQS